MNLIRWFCKVETMKQTYVYVESGECVDTNTLEEAIEKLSRWYPRELLNEDTVVIEEVAAAIYRNEKR